MRGSEFLRDMAAQCNRAADITANVHIAATLRELAFRQIAAAAAIEKTVATETGAHSGGELE